MGEEAEMNLWVGLWLLIVAGATGSWALAVIAGQGSRWLTYAFVALATYGMVFAVRGIARGFSWFAELRDPDLTQMGRVYAAGQIRREIIRGSGHLAVLALGVLALFDLPWFGRFFVAAIFYLVFTMCVNATADDVMDRRIKAAQAADTKRRVDEMREGGD